MSTYIIGLICAMILAAFVIAWITFCMFCKERHKSESYQYNISDLRRKNYEIAQEQMEENSAKEYKEVTAGIFIMPSRHKEDYSYEKRPDYPEGTLADLQPRTDKLIEIISDSPTDAEHKSVGFDLDSSVPYHSDV
ncbi:uncharacterized protein LOC123875640 [Maniola jurtina]|uniref:uncharacterized protein LOC123875640 n=1 Tax=Maniola jurtina TaxID=191418 RepID=UPI001E686D82|nr:uncharacterized protein LOC123875640 [Maniola jurtina]